MLVEKCYVVRKAIKQKMQWAGKKLVKRMVGSFGVVH